MSNLWVLPEELGDLADSEYAYEACKTASYILWGLSGRKISGLTKTTEIYRVAPGTRDINRIFMAQTEGHLLYEYFAHLPRKSTSILLKGRPVVGVDTVRLGPDRTVVDPDDYYLTDHSTLNFTFNLEQDVEVTYRYGGQPPVAGRMAAKTLAQQFALLWSGSDDCELPARVTSVTRQGITMTILDQQDFIADLRTGVYAVDLFLKTVNPDSARRKAKVFSPDVPRGQRITPKESLLPTSDLDIVVPRAAGVGSISTSLESVDAEFLATATGWTPQLVLHSYGSKRSRTLTTGVTVTGGTTLNVAITYTDATNVVGNVDPGVWDLYVLQDGVTTYIASGNLSVTL